MPSNLRKWTYDIQVTAPAQFAARQREIIMEAAEVGARAAAAVAPVKTGRLRASLRAQPLPNGAAFGSDVFYSGFQEFGTRYIAPRRYIQHGYEQSLAYLAQRGFTRGN